MCESLVERVWYFFVRDTVFYANDYDKHHSNNFCDSPDLGAALSSKPRYRVTVLGIRTSPLAPVPARSQSSGLNENSGCEFGTTGVDEGADGTTVLLGARD